jgi:hypothetical protein
MHDACYLNSTETEKVLTVGLSAVEERQGRGAAAWGGPTIPQGHAPARRCLDRVELRLRGSDELVTVELDSGGLLVIS